jgi:hypothetical protein
MAPFGGQRVRRGGPPLAPRGPPAPQRSPLHPPATSGGPPRTARRGGGTGAPAAPSGCRLLVGPPKGAASHGALALAPRVGTWRATKSASAPHQKGSCRRGTLGEPPPQPNRPGPAVPAEGGRGGACANFFHD